MPVYRDLVDLRFDVADSAALSIGYWPAALECMAILTGRASDTDADLLREHCSIARDLAANPQAKE